MNRAPVDRALLPGAEERTMLRDSVRGFLESNWPPEGAVQRAAQERSVSALWQGLAAQGLTALGADPTEGGLREIAIVIEELGRAAAPVPLPGHLLANLLLARAGNAPAGLLAALRGGAKSMTTAFAGAHGSVACDEGAATGMLRHVDHAPQASDLLVITEDGMLLIELREPDAAVCAQVVLGGPGWGEVRLERAVAQRFALEPGLAADARLLARLLLVARAHGAARRAFELAVDYAKERHQFGQPIGRFQAIQHKLANGLIALEGVRLTLHHAAEAFDFGSADWRYFAAAACAFGGQQLRQVSLETHHTFGAIGYAEEHEAPRHFRQVHRDTLALGGGAVARQELAAHFFDRGGTLPAYDLGPAGNAFRDTVRDWLARHWSGERKAAYEQLPFHDREFDASFARDLGATGWLGLAWPREHGGQARGAREQLALLEELERAGAPPRIGAAVQANALIMHGTPEQRARYLPEILRGEAMHGMGYSEPDAGSDLAALRTTAVRVNDSRGDGWLINGQKIWTTTFWGRYMFLAARTDRDAKPPHAGISMFIVPMDTPGITVKPAATMYDGSFANIFYDDVWVPADAIVGPVNGGWKVLTDALAAERGLVGGGIVLKVAHAFELLVEDVRGEPVLRGDAVVRDRLGQLAAGIEAGRQLMIHCAELAESGTTPPELGAISKVFSGELMERFGETALEVLGERAMVSQGSPGALRLGRYEQGLRHSLMWVISIGTNEIQRSLIAQRGLGLPR